MPKPPPASSPFWKLFEVVTRLNIVLFRATGGRIGGRMGKARILLLHHVGRRSGVERVAPLIYIADGDELVVVASKGGVDRHPAWFHNVTAHPQTTAELAGERRAVVARVADDAERARLWPLVVEAYGPYASYQEHTERTIPLVILRRAA